MIKRISFVTASYLLLACASYGSSIDITVKCHSGPKCDARGAVVLQSASNKSVVRRVNFAPSSFIITEQEGSEWDVSLEAKGFWALPQRVDFPAGGAHRQYAMDVWQTATLQGLVKVPDPQPATPITVRVVVSSRPDPRAPPELPRETSFDCSTEKTGQWRCTLPATSLDIAIRVDGYAPYHKWDVKLPVAGVIDLGTVKLVRGASLLVWLDSNFAKRVQVPVHALIRHESAPAVSAAAIRLGVPVAEGIFTKKGVVQLTPLAPGRYVLETQAKGYASVLIPVQLYAGKESTPRRSIALEPALSVRFHIQPPVGPGGIWWRVELWRSVGFGSGSLNAGSGVASPQGIFDATDQIEGPVRVFLKDSKQNILANRDVVITAAATDYEVNLDVSSVSGKVTIGDSSVPSATLLFGGSGGVEKIRTATDLDGRFTVNLPRRGKWIVDVDAPQEAIATTTEISIEKDDVDIKLPSTEVSGWVLDANGKRLSAVPVTLLSAGRPMVRTSEGDGLFRFRAIHDGPVHLQARDPRTHDYSKRIEVNVPEDGKVENIELSLESVRTIKGAVRSNGEPVVGARIHGYAILGGSARQEQATTDLEGGFGFDVPNSVNDVIIVVWSPGRTLETFDVPTNQDPIALELAPRGGTLKLIWTSGVKPIKITFNDQLIPTNDLFAWARSQGAKLDYNGVPGEIPNVAPGKYRLCAASHCQEGFLSIGGQLTLDTTR